VLPEAPVEYNGFQFQVSEARVYIPSVHTFNGQHVDAELIIVHYSVQGGTPVYICVPIVVGSSSSPTSSYLSAVGSVLSSLQPVAATQPTTQTATGVTAGTGTATAATAATTATSSTFVGESTTLPSPLDLSIFVPNAAFYQYRGTQLFTPFQGDVDYVVFSPDDAHANIRMEDFAVLAQVVTKHTYTTHTGPTLFRNNVGMIQRHMDDQIYIDCQPVGASDDTTLAYAIGTNGSSSDKKQVDVWAALSSFFSSEFVQVLFAGIIFVLMMGLLFYVYGKLDGNATGSGKLFIKPFEVNNFKSVIKR
jgi:carbonic anhydrase